MKDSLAETAINGIDRQRDVAWSIQQRLVDHINHKTTDRAEAPLQNDPEAYTSRYWFDREQEEIFHKLPLLAGLSADIPETGDKMLFTEAGPAILIMRGADGAVNAFLNMCTHRAAKLVTECTRSKRMTCRFHGWTFDLEGNLVGLPSAVSFEGLDRQGLQLIRIPVAEWNGLIFVEARPGNHEIDIDSYLGTFAPELRQMRFDLAQPVKKSRLEVAANWKYALDTYSEGYHFSTLHANSIGKAALNDMMVYDRFAPHHRINFPYYDQLPYAEKAKEEWPRRPYGGIHLLFPNTILNISSMGPGQAFGVYRMFPGENPDNAFTMMATYRSGMVDAATDKKPWEDFHDFIKNVVRTEDYSVSKDGQENLKYAPKNFKVIYGSNEAPLQNFHKHVAQLIGRVI